LFVIKHLYFQILSRADIFSSIKLHNIISTVVQCIDSIKYTRAKQVGICRHNTHTVHIDKHSGTLPVILARHWLWLPVYGSCLNRNMLQQYFMFMVPCIIIYSMK